MKRIHIGIFIAIAVSAWSGALVWSQDANGDRITVSWSDPSRPGLLKVNLIQGGITVKTHSGNNVIVEGRSRGGNNRRPAPPDAGGLRRIDGPASGLVVEESNNVISVATQSFSRFVDLDIQVPSKTSLNLKTMNGGNIVIEGVDGEIEVTNMNGGGTLNNISGSVVAHLMNGKVVASLRQTTANKPMAFTSMNGNIDVTLPPSLKANMKMRTDNGEIYSDFDIQNPPSNGPTTTDNRSRGGPFRVELDKNVLGAVNGGGPDFDLRTLNGNIYIRKGTQ